MLSRNGLPHNLSESATREFLYRISTDSLEKVRYAMNHMIDSHGR